MIYRRAFLALVSVAALVSCWACQGPHDLNSSGRGRISSIGIRHLGCLNTCPVYDVTLQRDRKATYVGKDHARLTGSFSGRVSDDDFERLAGLLEAKDFFRLGDQFHAPGGDVGETIEISGQRGDTMKTIKRDGPAGADDLSQIARAIDEVVDKIDWR